MALSDGWSYPREHAHWPLTHCHWVLPAIWLAAIVALHEQESIDANAQSHSVPLLVGVLTLSCQEGASAELIPLATISAVWGLSKTKTPRLKAC